MVDRIPKPDQVVAAASNVAQKMLYGGLADLRPMPRTLIDEGELREVYHYRPAASTQVQGDPVLLVTPLAAPSICYDLRRGCSVVEHLVTSGRPTYLVEYGEVSFRNRGLGMEHWVDEVLPEGHAALGIPGPRGAAGHGLLRGGGVGALGLGGAGQIGGPLSRLAVFVADLCGRAAAASVRRTGGSPRGAG